MRYGNINCICSQGFYFETAHRTISCIKCGKIHNILEFPVKSDDEAIEESVQDFVEEIDYTPKEGGESGVEV